VQMKSAKNSRKAVGPAPITITPELRNVADTFVRSAQAIYEQIPNPDQSISFTLHFGSVDGSERALETLRQTEAGCTGWMKDLAHNYQQQLLGAFPCGDERPALVQLQKCADDLVVRWDKLPAGQSSLKTIAERVHELRQLTLKILKKRAKMDPPVALAKGQPPPPPAPAPAPPVYPEDDKSSKSIAGIPFRVLFAEPMITLLGRIAQHNTGLGRLEMSQRTWEAMRLFEELFNNYAFESYEVNLNDDAFEAGEDDARLKKHLETCYESLRALISEGLTQVTSKQTPTTPAGAVEEQIPRTESVVGSTEVSSGGEEAGAKDSLTKRVLVRIREVNDTGGKSYYTVEIGDKAIRGTQQVTFLAVYVLQKKYGVGPWPKDEFLKLSFKNGLGNFDNRIRDVEWHYSLKRKRGDASQTYFMPGLDFNSECKPKKVEEYLLDKSSSS